MDGGLNLILGKEKGTDLGLPGKLGTVIVVVQLLSVSDSLLDCSTTGFLVLHCLPEFAQTHVP